MANYYGTTASSGAYVKKGMKKKLKAYLELWGFAGDGEIETPIRTFKGGDTLHIYGGEDFSPCPIATKETDEYDVGDYMYDECDPVGFIKGLAPFLKPHGKIDPILIAVQTVGSTKCCYPLGAWEIILFPDGTVKTNQFANLGGELA
jgi:hypothetical protein